MHMNLTPLPKPVGNNSLSVENWVMKTEDIAQGRLVKEMLIMLILFYVLVIKMNEVDYLLNYGNVHNVLNKN